jgi:hypothetical protein
VPSRPTPAAARLSTPLPTGPLPSDRKPPAPVPEPETTKPAAARPTGAQRSTGDVTFPASSGTPPLPSAADFPQILSATNRDAIAVAALEALARRFERSAVFICRPNAICGFGARGAGVDAEAVRRIEIPWTVPSVFLNVKLSLSFYLGKLPPLLRHEAIARALGDWTEECVVQPVVIRDRPVAFLYADFSRDRGATPHDLAYLRELAGVASTAFAGAIRLKKKEI